MIGSIAGDIIGSVHEYESTKTRDFPLFQKHSTFTDDTVLTVAVADAILSGRPYRESVIEIGRRYPRSGYGSRFLKWLSSKDPQPYQSWGNGSAMRVSPVGFAFGSEAEVLREAEKTAVISHDHPEGIKGAQAAALAVFLARKGGSKKDIKKKISRRFGYDLDRTVDGIRDGVNLSCQRSAVPPGRRPIRAGGRGRRSAERPISPRPPYSYDISCQGTVPEAIIAFLESDSYEDAVRNAISLGGDADTLACITGGIAEAFYGGVPDPIREKALGLLTPDLREITESFCEKYIR